jgi:phage baseplate assembly protein W
MRDPETAFLGTGWSFPPTFTRHGLTVVTATGAADVRQSLWVLFSTAPGERVMLPTYGCGIWRMVFRTLTTTATTEIADAVAKAVLEWEPRVDLDGVAVKADPEQQGLVTVSVDYVIRTTNTRDNLVYPFYLREGTLVPAAA